MARPADNCTSVTPGSTSTKRCTSIHAGVRALEVADDERAIFRVFQQRDIVLRQAKDAERGLDLPFARLSGLPLIVNARVHVIANVMVDVPVLLAHANPAGC